MTSETPARSKHVRRLLLFVITALMLAATYRYQTAVAITVSEEEALAFVRMHGFTSEGYTGTLLSDVLSLFPRIPLPSRRPLGTTPVVGVAFPRDQMTNYMADQLLNIRYLDTITLYPPAAVGSGVDFDATGVSPTRSLGELDLPVSENRITALE